jgi:hemolysin III
MTSPYPKSEDVASAITHGVGVLVSLVAGTVLIARVAAEGDAVRTVSAAVYVASLVVLYVASTLSHVVRAGPARARLEIFDHCAIFVLIAGTYTPFTLITLRGPLGWALFGVVWGLAAVGVIFKLIWIERFRRFSTLVYVLMGWLILVALEPLLKTLPRSVLLWMLGGNLLYSVGLYFLIDRRVRYGHAIWHVFALAGSVCHFIAVASQVLPAVVT